MRVLRQRSLVTSSISALLVALVSGIAAAQGGTVTGTVTEQGAATPLQEARVIVVGTSLFATTGPDGKYILRRVPAGTAEIRVIHVGNTELKKSVSVTDNGNAILDFALAKSIIQLQEVVTTATGEQRRVEIGNAVENVSVAALAETQPIRNMADVLNSRVPGVMVQSGGQTGSGQRVRVRGVSSVSLSNDPIYVIDGVRMSANNSSTAFDNGGSNFSRLGDIDPQSIENIEIVKGPSAATLYGTDAANGVIVITTKKGRSGSARWSTFVEGGILDDRNWYSDNYTLAGVSPSGSPLILGGQCNLPMVSAGTCLKTGGTKGYDSLRVYNPITDPNATPLGYGNRNAVGLQVSGGSDALRYFMSAGRDNEIGVFDLPQFERDRYDSLGLSPHEWTTRPNARLMNSFRGNISASVTPQFDAGLNFGYITVDQRTSPESNATIGIGSQAFGGPGYVGNGLVSGVNTPLHGYRAWTPAYSWEEKTQQNINRALLSSNLNWRPLSWLSARSNIGADLTDRVDYDLNMNGEGAPITATQRDGYARNARANITNLSADISATANYNPKRWSYLNFKTTLGTQYNNFRQDQNLAGGQTLPPGAQSASANATPNATEATTITKTLGLFVEENLGIRDRVYLTGAVRTDQNSAFGTNFQRVYYPKGSLSWVMSDEDFFPKSGPIFSQISSFRLRVAYGASGVQPGSNTANQTFQTAKASVKGTDQPVEQFQTIGNDSLKPERSTEWELGWDSRLFGNRLQFDLTYYSRSTQDALIAAPLAPSLGIGATSQQQNLGRVKNAGLEMTIGGPIIDRRAIGIDFNIATSMNANKVVSLGSVTPILGTTNWVIPGYPIRGLFATPITGWQDKNGDGILTHSEDPNLNEVFVSKDTIFRGYAEPRYLTSFNSGIELFARKLRIQNLFDWRGGNKWYNNTERIRCVSRQNCNGLVNPSASFQEQAMVVATLNDPLKTLDGFLQPGAFVKWREMSAALTLPDRLASTLRSRNASLVFSARNLKTWTNYRGTNPESDFAVGEGGDSPSEFQTFSAPTYFILRLNLGF